MSKAKEDHLAFVARVEGIVSAREKLSPDALASPHHCRFGRWYDGVSDVRALGLPSFKAIRRPHESVHALGRRVLIALGADDPAAAQRDIAEMRSASQEVLRCLDALGRDFPQTFAKEAA